MPTEVELIVLCFVLEQLGVQPGLANDLFMVLFSVIDFYLKGFSNASGLHTFKSLIII